MSDKSRRKLLKAIALGSGGVLAGKSLPESWNRPIVDSVLLPVHAQTSAATSGTIRGTALYSGNGLRASISGDNNSLFARVTDLTVSEANADAAPGTYLIDACATDDGNNLIVDIQVIDVNVPSTRQYSAVLPTSGGVVSTTPRDMCSTAATSATDMNIDSVTSAFANINLQGVGLVAIPTAGSCVPFSSPQCTVQQQCETGCNDTLAVELRSCNDAYTREVAACASSANPVQCERAASQRRSTCIAVAKKRNASCRKNCARIIN